MPCEDCFQCIHQSWRCTWELKGKSKSCVLCWDNKQCCEPVGASGALSSLKRIAEDLEDVEGAPKKKRVQVVGNSLELLELNKTLKEISEGIQGGIGGINDWRRMDAKVLSVLQDIWSLMWDFM